MAAGLVAGRCPELVERLVFFAPITWRQKQTEPQIYPAWRLVSLKDQWDRFTQYVPYGERAVLNRRDFNEWGELYLDTDPESRMRSPASVKTLSGPWQDIALAGAGQLAYDPASIRAPVAEAATLPTAGVVAWRGLVVCGQMKSGDTVLILGTGGVSLFALQFAKAAGARVIATSSSEEKLEKLKRFGAEAVINYKSVPEWGQRAKDLTDGRGVDHVVEVGGPATLAQSITACRLGGHIALIGVLTGFTAEVSIGALLSNQIRISGLSVGYRADQEDMIRAITANGLKPIIDRSFPLQEIAAAFKYYESQKHFGNVCLEL
jgi:NADPH:quinone reductase-like Zn-dependent oxidoreductase